VSISCSKAPQTLLQRWLMELSVLSSTSFHTYRAIRATILKKLKLITYQHKTAGDYHFVRKKKYSLKWLLPLVEKNRKKHKISQFICGNWKTSRTSRRFQRVNRVKELIPSGQLYSSILNTGINIRGLGSPYGLMTGLILVLVLC
jgi:hypothetical protein